MLGSIWFQISIKIQLNSLQKARTKSHQHFRVISESSLNLNDDCSIIHRQLLDLMGWGHGPRKRRWMALGNWRTSESERVFALGRRRSRWSRREPRLFSDDPLGSWTLAAMGPSRWPLWPGMVFLLRVFTLIFLLKIMTLTSVFTEFKYVVLKFNLHLACSK